MPGLTIDLLPELLAVCRLPASAAVPSWAAGADFLSFTRTSDELSIVCSSSSVPAGVTAHAGWRSLKVRGPLDFGLVGIMVSIAQPLAEASVSIVPIGTYDTDYVLVPEAQLSVAIDALTRAGHVVCVAEGR